MKVQNLTEYLIILLTTCILLLSPMLKGVVEPYSRVIIRSLIIITFILTLASLRINGIGKISLNDKKLLFLLLFIAFSLIQIIPLPKFLINLIANSNYEIWNNSSNIIKEITSSTNYFYTISLIPYNSINKLLTIICYLLFGFILTNLFKKRRNIILIIYVITLAATIQSLIGFYQYIEGNTFKPSQNVASGTFVSKNNFAGFLELIIPLVFASLIYFVSRKNSLKKFLQTFYFLLIFLVFTVAFILSFSRFGYFSLLNGVVFLFISLVIYKHYKKINYLFYFLLGSSFIGFILSLNLNFFIKYLDNLPSFTGLEGRIHIWKDTISAIKDFLVFGSGLGTFEYLYPLYKSIPQHHLVNFAHNDYLEILLETGLIGFSLLIIPLFMVLRQSFNNLEILYRQKDKFYFYITLGCISSILIILIHSFADFNFHIPSNTIYFVVLISILVSTNSKIINK